MKWKEKLGQRRGVEEDAHAMQALAPVHLYHPLHSSHGHPRPFFFSFSSLVTTRSYLIPRSFPSLPLPFRSSLSDSQHQIQEEQGAEEEEEEEEDEETISSCEDDDTGFQIEIDKPPGKKNRRSINARVRVNADLETVWSVLTDYEGLADFIPSLAVSQLLDRRDCFARLYQVGQQDLALGLKFNAKGVLDCFEGDLEMIPGGRRRDIQFNMVEGDFQLFQGSWSIEQMSNDLDEDEASLTRQEYKTTLSYTVELEPKLWLPVGLLEGRLSREVKVNLLSVREEAQRVQRTGNHTLPVF